MTYYVSSGTLNPTHSLTPTDVTCKYLVVEIEFRAKGLESVVRQSTTIYGSHQQQLNVWVRLVLWLVTGTEIPDCLVPS